MTTAGEARGGMPDEMPAQAGARAGGAQGGGTRAASSPGAGPDEAPEEAHGHQHRDVSGGWLRPAVFGAMDGLVTNASLIAGVGGGGGSQHAILLTGLAGLAAG